MKTQRSLNQLMILAWLGLGHASNVQAELLVYEPFDYPADSDILGQSGGHGFTGAWMGYEGNSSAVPAGSFKTVSGSLAHPTASLITTGNSAIATGEFGTLQPARDFNNIAVEEGDTIWISFIGQRLGEIQDPPANGDNQYPRGVNISFFDADMLANASRAERVGIGNSSNATANEWSIIPEGSGSARVGGGSPYDELQWAVMRIDYVGDETVPDDFYLWLSPDPAVEPTLETANVTILNDDPNARDASDLDFLRPFIGDNSGDRPYGVLALDELRIGTTYADMSALPGPPETELEIAAVMWNGSDFNITVNGLDTAGTYDLLRGSTVTDITEVVTTLTNPAATDTFTDTAPTGDRGFYVVQSR